MQPWRFDSDRALRHSAKLWRALLQMGGAGLITLLAACSTTPSQSLASNLSAAVLDNDDPDLVRDGAPAHMLLVEGLLRGDPDDPRLLLAAARLYSAYATVFVADPERSRRMADKGRTYAKQALCQRAPQICTAPTMSFDEFTTYIQSLSDGDLETLYTYATALTAYIQAGETRDYDALADLPKVTVMMKRVIEIDETYEYGRPYLYMGAIEARLPANLGGRPEVARAHFERAIEISHGRDLRAKVEYARRYARLTFDRALHDRLLQQVLEADPVTPGLTLSNVIAQKEAGRLLETSAEFFE